MSEETIKFAICHVFMMLKLPDSFTDLSVFTPGTT